MATANSAGDIALWNLQTRQLSYNMKGAHDGSVTLACFLVGQPLLISAGADNAVKVNQKLVGQFNRSGSSLFTAYLLDMDF